MLFTPKKRGKEYYRAAMLVFYSASALFGIAAPFALLLPEEDVHGGRAQSFVAFLVASVILWAVGRACSSMMDYAARDTRRRH